MAETTMTIAQPSNYWIASDAVYITLNAMGNPDYLQGSVASGAMIMCYMRGIDGLSYDAGHNYRRWPLTIAPTFFNTTTEKYIYVAIPKSDAVNAYAQIVFPSVKLDIYGKDADGNQLGSTDYFYIWLQGIISASVDANSVQQQRAWISRVNTGTLASDEAIAGGGEGSWFSYSSVDDTVTFLKTIVKATFDNLTAKVANITQLVLGNGKDVLDGVAKFGETLDTATNYVVSPKYLKDYGAANFLSKVNEDTAAKKIHFKEGMDVGDGKYGVDSAGNAILNDITGRVGKLEEMIADLMQSKDFSSDNPRWGKGFGFFTEDGASHGFLDFLTVRTKMYVEELEVRVLSRVAGDYAFTKAGLCIGVFPL